MLRHRIIPNLLIRDECLVKTRKFGEFNYIGDPCNTVRIFNEFEVDELLVLDILATHKKRRPNFSLLKDIANECFMPLAYGGGIRTLNDAKSIFDIGFEKIVINSYAVENPEFVRDISKYFGSQAIIVSIDVLETYFGRKYIKTNGGRLKHNINPVEFAKNMEELGAGEILLTSVRKEGTWDGFDIDLIKDISTAVNIPVIANGGAGKIEDIVNAIVIGNASAVGLGSLLLFQRKGMGVLINYPKEIEEALDKIKDL